MRICARCFGSNIGHIAALIALGFGVFPKWYWSLLLVAPLAVDWGLQEKFGVMSNNTRRLVTGVLGGLGVGFIVWGALMTGIKIVIDAVL